MTHAPSFEQVRRDFDPAFPYRTVSGERVAWLVPAPGLPGLYLGGMERNGAEHVFDGRGRHAMRMSRDGAPRSLLTLGVDASLDLVNEPGACPRAKGAEYGPVRFDTGRDACLHETVRCVVAMARETWGTVETTFLGLAMYAEPGETASEVLARYDASCEALVGSGRLGVGIVGEASLAIPA